MARQVGSRDRLVRADQIQNDAPIDIARGFARGDLKVRQIDSSHSVNASRAASPDSLFAFDVLRFNSWRELISRNRNLSQ